MVLQKCLQIAALCVCLCLSTPVIPDYVPKQPESFFFSVDEFDFSLIKSQICYTTRSDLLVTAPSFMRTSNKWVWPEVFIF